MLDGRVRDRLGLRLGITVTSGSGFRGLSTDNIGFGGPQQPNSTGIMARRRPACMAIHWRV